MLHIYEPLSGNELFRILAGGTQHGRWYGNEYAYGDFNGDGSTDLIPGHTGNSDLSVTLWGGGRLLLSTPCDFTLRRRSSCTFSIYGDAPGRTVHLMASHAGNGCTFIPKLGLCLDLDQPFMEVATAVTDLEGWARMEVKVPADAPPGTVWLQAIDPNHYWLGPITSNVWRMMVG
ncbi:MAG: hypothetical protein D8M59_13235 [Planctomycetes bacterium]|nr:hypothetical protein [Planctomycetota bacterium]